jgi:sugar lactone lactonase YvrE
VQGMERVASGFSLAEAPVVTEEDVLLVSDVLAGGVRRFDVDGLELDPLLESRRGIGGMGLLANGSVVVSGRDLSVVHADGTSVVLAALLDGGTGYNDLAVDDDGMVVAGMLTCRPMAGETLTPGVLVGVGPGGPRWSTPLPFCWPNGVGFSPVGDMVYIADFATGVVHRGPWGGDTGELMLEPWVTSPSGDADGLAVSDDGHVLVAAGAGGAVLCYDATGELVDRIAVPDDFVSSCCFWPGRHRLVVTTGTGVFVRDLG